uniref:Uncharacterized protein n=1 Tax=Neobodo designis TaxID=312471 RepID=A0A7S1Q5V5_NEODS
MRRLGVRLAKASAATLPGGKAAAAKAVSDEKFGQTCLEYIYEMNRPNAVQKTNKDAEEEMLLAQAVDRLFAIGDSDFHDRLEAQVARGIEALEALPEELRVEACLLNSEMPPLSFRRPSLTPPLSSYDPAFGLDVPANRARIAEYPAVHRIDDDLLENDRDYPLLPPDVVSELNGTVASHLQETHRAARSTIPQTGPMGEAWEAEIALQKRACARQDLLLKLADDPDMAERFDTDEEYRATVLGDAGLAPLAQETAHTGDEACVPQLSAPLHYSQTPKHFARKG